MLCELFCTGFPSDQNSSNRMAAIFVVLFCSLALPVTSNRNDFNAHFSAYLPGIIQDVWHISDFTGTAEDGPFLNGVHLPHTFDGFASGFLMPNDIHGLLERRNSFSLRIMNCMPLKNTLLNLLYLVSILLSLIYVLL